MGVVPADRLRASPRASDGGPLLRDRPKERFWLLLDRPDAEACVTHPGFDEDLIVVTDSWTLTQVHMGRLPITHAIQDGTWEAQGPPELARALMTWGGLSPYADVAPACADQMSIGQGRTRHGL